MSIENVGNLNNILNTHKTANWAKSVDLDGGFLKDVGGASQANPAKGKSFSYMLNQSIMEVNGLQQDADIAVQKLASGQFKNLHETMLAVEKADIAFRSMNQIRMKVIDAYKEIMRMQV